MSSKTQFLAYAYVSERGDCIWNHGNSPQFESQQLDFMYVKHKVPSARTSAQFGMCL